MSGNIVRLWAAIMLLLVLDGMTLQWGGWFNVVLALLMLPGLPILSSWAARMEKPK